MNRRTFTAMALLGFGVATALPQAGFAQSDPFLGTWQLNLAKSKWSPGPLPKSQTASVQAEGQNHSVTVTGIDAAGKPTSAVFTRIYDAQSHPAGPPSPPDFDAATLTRVDSNTIIISRTKAGKLVQTITNVLSQDGKMLTVTTIGIDANGRPLNNNTIYDKQ
jgi:hypothetical protein